MSTVYNNTMDKAIAASTHVLAVIDGLVLTPKQVAYLCAYVVLCGRVSGAAAAVGISWGNHWNWMKEPDYAKAFELVKPLSAQYLLDEATRRAAQGYEKPVWYKGELVGWEQAYSDTLMNTLLKGEFPEKYAREINETRIKGDKDREVMDKIPRTKLSDDDLAILVAAAKQKREENGR